MAGIDSYTKLMLHMDDTGLTDSSSSSHTPTLNGDVTRSATESKFGGYSAYFDGTGDYISFPDSDDWYLDEGTGDFTIDMWINLSDNANRICFVGQYSSTLTEWMFAWHPDGTIGFHYRQSGTDKVSIWENSASTYNTGQWYHIAVSKSSDSWYLFKDGVVVGTGTDSDGPHNMNGIPLTVGYSFNLGNAVYGYMDGYIDELRISKGVARWTSNFTPPTKAYSEYDYYLSGNAVVSGTLLVIDESDWSLDYSGVIAAGDYQVGLTISGTALAAFTVGEGDHDGEVIAYGGLTPTEG